MPWNNQGGGGPWGGGGNNGGGQNPWGQRPSGGGGGGSTPPDFDEMIRKGPGTPETAVPRWWRIQGLCPDWYRNRRVVASDRFLPCSAG